MNIDLEKIAELRKEAESQHEYNANPAVPDWDAVSVGPETLLAILDLAEEALKMRTGRVGGYAPGNYHSLCCNCRCEFIGDKRAVQCLACALRLTTLPDWEKTEVHPTGGTTS